MMHVIFDIETTGLYVERGHRIIEIGAVSVNGNTMEEEFQSLIHSKKRISKAAYKVHGIAAEMLADQPDVKEVLSDFRRFMGTSTLVAHNADFDMSFLRSEYRRLGNIFTNPYKCTLHMSRKYYPGLPDYKLETVARHLGIQVDIKRRHRALDYAQLAVRVWMEIRRSYEYCDRLCSHREEACVRGAHSFSRDPGEGGDQEEVK